MRKITKRKHRNLQKKIKELLKEFQDIHEDLPNELPPYRTHQHEIVEEPGSKPTLRAPYRLSPTELADMKKEIEFLLAKGLIRPSSAIRCPSTRHNETRRKPAHVHRLPSSQQADHQEQIPNSMNR
ncbi:hypothetical protein CLOP_g18119 [Closterium sp. NIES-67]|nr:hypothetical protein CLOP_g18119 [Closterium sp. NIES-67]